MFDTFDTQVHLEELEKEYLELEKLFTDEAHQDVALDR